MEKGVTLQENILNKALCLNTKLIVIGYWMFAGEFYSVNGEFPDLWCLMNTQFWSDVILISGPDTNIILAFTI